MLHQPKTKEGSSFSTRMKDVWEVYHGVLARNPDMRSCQLAAIGTRGTVGSLITQEIAFFNRLDVSRCNKQMQKRKGEFCDAKLAPVCAIPVKKKWEARGFIPSICSTVEIANEVSSLNYRSLKADIKSLST